jgi:MFS family permease
MIALTVSLATVVATLLTPIGSYFKKSNQASYLGTSYLLSVCCFTPLYGRLSDILGAFVSMVIWTWTDEGSPSLLGRKGALLLAMSLFIGGTILCGISTSMGMLIAARTIAGMGGGGYVYFPVYLSAYDLRIYAESWLVCKMGLES